MTKPSRIESYCAAIIERSDNHVLIALPKQDQDLERRWLFPRGPSKQGETPEDGLRRVVLDQLGLQVEIVVGQPPIACQFDNMEVELRYFFCGTISGEASKGPYQEIRWIPRGHLSEYDFDEGSQPVADWVLEERGG